MGRSGGSSARRSPGELRTGPGRLPPGAVLGRRGRAWGWLVAALTAQLLSTPATATQQPRYGTTPGTTPRRFEIDSGADEAFRALWAASAATGAERVACIGGERRDGVGHITRVLALAPEAADSLGIAASASIEQCAPPDWFGTAHTHIALYDGLHPEPTFSGADRGVMMLWWRRWRVDGIFCVLYSPKNAHCETLGASGGLIAGPGTQASY